ESSFFGLMSALTGCGHNRSCAQRSLLPLRLQHRTCSRLVGLVVARHEVAAGPIHRAGVKRAVGAGQGQTMAIASQSRCCAHKPPDASAAGSWNSQVKWLNFKFLLSNAREYSRISRG